MILPFKLAPAYKDYLWGGTKLKTDFHKNTDLSILAESWELSAHPDGDCVINSGEFSGMKFSQFLQEYPGVLGMGSVSGGEFPVLIKLIDAAKPLSIQVHPNDDYARQVEGGQGKTELWYILDCEPDAFLYFGFEREISRAEFERRIAEDTLIEVLHKAPVHPGDVFFIGAGTLHAIGAGILLAEVQQNSNTTYRVYDYGRCGADGKRRALHVEKALAVTSLSPAPIGAPGAEETVNQAGYATTRLAKCDYFTLDHLVLTDGNAPISTEETFVSLVCVAGEAMLSYAGKNLLPIGKGDSIFIPADAPEVLLSGSGVFLITRQ